jgi:hypothetical protein
VVSHGRHHHNRLRVASEPSESGLNDPAGSSQNMHAGPLPAPASIHPVVLAVAACIPSNLGVPFTVVLRDGSYRDHRDRTWRRFRLGCHPVTSTLRVAVA